MKKGFTIVSFTFAALCGSADATVYFQDSFNSYGATDLAGQGNWFQTSTPSGNPVQVSGGAATFISNGQDVYHALNSAVPGTAGTSIFMSVRLTLSAVQSSGDYFLHFSDPVGTASFYYNRIFAKSSASGFVLGLTAFGGAEQYSTTQLSLGTPYTLVASWNFAASPTNDTFALYINPTSSTEAGNTPYLSYTWVGGGDIDQMTAVNIRQGATSAGPTGTIDDMIVASTFAEVVPAPEPTTAVSLLCGLAVLGGRRRRR